MFFYHSMVRTHLQNVVTSIMCTYVDNEKNNNRGSRWCVFSKGETGQFGRWSYSSSPQALALRATFLRTFFQSVSWVNMDSGRAASIFS